MNLYLPSGYLNIAGILQLGLPFNFIVGGRGTGKTYGALKYAVESGRMFMLMRRTQEQCNLINKPQFSPFKDICIDTGWDIRTESISKYNAAFMRGDECIGYTCALSTIANLRGFSAADVTLCVYDEFVKEIHERPIKGEGEALLNAYETMNRNRELKGQKPMQLLCLANAFDIANPIFMTLGLVGIAERMKQKQQEVYVNRESGIALFLPMSEKISGAKAKTALYKATTGAYTEMALSNDFAYNPTDYIKSQPLKEYSPMVTVGEITVYRHKSGRKFYVTEHRSGNPDTYKTDEVDIKRFIRKYGRRLYLSYMAGRIYFENIYCKSLFEVYIV